MSIDMTGHVADPFTTIPTGGVTLIRDEQGHWDEATGDWVVDVPAVSQELTQVNIQPVRKKTMEVIVGLGGNVNPRDVRELWINDGVTYIYPPDYGYEGDKLEFSDGLARRTWRVLDADNRPWHNYCHVVVERIRNTPAVAPVPPGPEPEPDPIADAVSAAFSGDQLGGLYVIQPEYNGSPILWQDEAGTIPATTDGQVVRRIDDLSGAGNHLTTDQPATLRADGAVWYLEFDGSTSYYNLPPSLSQNATSLYMATACRYTELSGADKSMLWFSTGTSGTSTRARLNTRATDYLQTAGRRDDEGSFDVGLQAEVIVLNEKFVGSALLDYSTATAWLRKNGAEVGSGSFSTPGVSSNTPSLESYAGWQSGEYTAMDAYAFAIVKNGADGISEIETLMAGLISA